MKVAFQKTWNIAFIPVVSVLLIIGFSLSREFVTIAAGVSIFLLGMLFLEDGFRTLAGGTLDRILRYSTNGLGKSLAFGIFSTSLVQSSTLVSVLTISFLSAGLISLSSGIGVILGANLGTTTGAWIIAGLGLKLSISAYAMPVLVFGALLIFQGSKSWKGVGYILVGISFFFMGIDFMKEGFDAFKSDIDLTQFAIEGFFGVVVFTVVGAAITIIMQSSHAALGLILTALSLHQVSYENALALAIGSNIGTTVTAVISAVSARVEGKRLAGAHLLFNVFTGIVAIIFIHPLSALVDWISEFLTIAADDYTLKLAVFHSLFNLLGICLTIPCMKQLEQLLIRFFPSTSPVITKPIYLDASTVEFPKAAIQAATNESMRLYDITVGIVCHGIGIKRRNVFETDKSIEDVLLVQTAIKEDISEKYTLHVKSLYSELVKYISLASVNASAKDAERLHEIRLAGNFLAETIKSIQQLQPNLSRYMEIGNEKVFAEYNKLRGLIIRVIREIETIRRDIQNGSYPDVHDVMIAFEEMKVFLVENDLRTNDEINVLLRESAIDPATATSLINDSGHVYNACKKLLKAVQILLVGGQEKSRSAVKKVELDETDISQLVKGVAKK